MKQFTFEKENFQPDYIAFKFEVLDWYDRKQLKCKVNHELHVLNRT